MSDDDVLFGYRLQLFDLAARTTVTEACRVFGIHRSTYYSWKRRIEHVGCTNAAGRDETCRVRKFIVMLLGRTRESVRQVGHVAGPELWERRRRGLGGVVASVASA